MCGRYGALPIGMWATTMVGFGSLFAEPLAAPVAAQDAAESFQPDAGPESDPEADSKAEAEAEPEPEPGTEPNSDAETEPDPEPEPEAEPEAEAEPNPGADPGPTADPEPEPDPEPETAADPETETAAEYSPDEDYEYGAVAEVEADIEEKKLAAPSDFDIQLGALARVPRADAQSMLTLTPGVFLSQHATTGHTAGMFLRGFDAAEGEDLEVTVEGIPLNEVSNAHGHGYTDTGFVMPELVHGLRVIQGPFDPAQGDFAVAGSVDYRLGLEERGVHAKAGYGRFGERRAGLWWGPKGQSTGTLAGLNLHAGDGFGPNRAFENGSVLGQYEGTGRNAELRYRVLAFASAASWDTAGVVRQDDFEARRLPCENDRDSQLFCLYDPNQGGSSQRVGVSSSVAWRSPNQLIDARVFALGRGLEIRENFTGFNNDPRTDGGAQRGDLAEQRYQALTAGQRTTYRQQFRGLGREQEVEVGSYLRFDQVDTRTDRLRDELGVPYRTDFDREIQQVNLAGYINGNLALLDWWDVVVGVRLDYFGYQVEDNNFPTEDRIGERLGRATSTANGFAVQPRGSLRFRLVKDLTYFISGGWGARSSDAAALSEGEFAPFARVVATETGLIWALQGQSRNRHAFETAFETWDLECRASAFFTRVEQDLVFDPVAGRNSLVGPTHRMGVMGYVKNRLASWLSQQASVTYTEARLATGGLRGSELVPFVPRWLLRWDVAATHYFKMRRQAFLVGAGFGLSHVGRRPLPLSEFAQPFTIGSASVTARWRWLELGVRAENLWNVRYRAAEFNYPSNFDGPSAPTSSLPTRHFAAGPPFTALAELRLHFDFEGSKTPRQ